MCTELKNELEKQAYLMYAINEMKIMINTLERKFYLSDLEEITKPINMESFDNLKLVDLSKKLKKSKSNKTLQKSLKYVKGVNNMLENIVNEQTNLLTNYNLSLVINSYENIQFKYLNP